MLFFFFQKSMYTKYQVLKLNRENCGTILFFKYHMLFDSLLQVSWWTGCKGCRWVTPWPLLQLRSSPPGRPLLVNPPSRPRQPHCMLRRKVRTLRCHTIGFFFFYKYRIRFLLLFTSSVSFLGNILYTLKRCRLDRVTVRF